MKDPGAAIRRFACTDGVQQPARWGRQRPARCSLLAARFCVLLLVAVALPVSAQSVAITPVGTYLVAHDGVVEHFGRNAKDRLWRVPGVEFAGTVVTSESSAAVIDPIANRVRMIDMRNGDSREVRTGDTPIDATFLDGRLYVLERDARALERIASDGSKTSVTVAADSAFLRAANHHIYVYSRTGGSIQEVNTSEFGVSRTIAAQPFASDFEIDNGVAYTVYPRDGMIRMTDLATGRSAGEWRVGAVPVDLAFAASPSSLTPRLIAVADPSAKRVWVVEGKQSVMQAFMRGFLRGLIGLGLFGGRESRFPGGVDRLAIRGSASVAYDSSSSTLYRFSKDKVEVLGRGVAPAAFAVAPHTVAWWQNGTLVAQKVP